MKPIIFTLLLFSMSCASSMMTQKTILKQNMAPFVYRDVYFTAKAIQEPGNIYQMGAPKGHKFIDVYLTIQNRGNSNKMINYRFINMGAYDGNIQNAYPPLSLLERP